MTKKTVEVPLDLLKSMTWAAEKLDRKSTDSLVARVRLLIAEAERPEIKDLPAGTLFTATVIGQSVPIRFVYIPTRAYPLLNVATGGGYLIDSIDESTIKDIVLPEESK